MLKVTRQKWAVYHYISIAIHISIAPLIDSSWLDPNEGHTAERDRSVSFKTHKIKKHCVLKITRQKYVSRSLSCLADHNFKTLLYKISLPKYDVKNISVIIIIQQNIFHSIKQLILLYGFTYCSPISFIYFVARWNTQKVWKISDVMLWACLKACNTKHDTPNSTRT